ncbi:hypothetical protein EDC01DRAFT_783220 [Geopyxis carbonaria]|nr:hypothetical protein EDC01DRAFT_783220 [Geopyxis carbonaria]
MTLPPELQQRKLLKVQRPPTGAEHTPMKTSSLEPGVEILMLLSIPVVIVVALLLLLWQQETMEED